MVFDFHILLPVVCLMIDGYVQYVWIYFKMLSKHHAAIICFVKDAFLKQLNVLYAIKE